jgi:hypothetical protein
MRYTYMFLKNFVAALVILIAFSALYPLSAGTPRDQRKLDRLIQKLDHMQRVCVDPELAELMAYTSRQYSHIGWSGISVTDLEWASVAGVNNPLFPGMTLDRECFEKMPDTLVIGLILHEAMHDYPPYLYHTHMTHLVPTDGVDNAYDNMAHNRDW